jgi:hypothetical protein
VYLSGGPNHGTDGLFGFLTAVSADLTEGNAQSSRQLITALKGRDSFFLRQCCLGPLQRASQDMVNAFDGTFFAESPTLREQLSHLV